MRKLDSLTELFVEQIQDLYDSEIQLVDVMPKLIEASATTELKTAFDAHLAETMTHVSRLETIFENLGQKAQRDSCQGMKGLVAECNKTMKAEGDPTVKDAAIVAAAQRVEHYEIAGYGVARSLALQLGRNDFAEILQRTLDEEGAADRTLTDIAENLLNPEAAQARRRNAFERPGA